MRIRLVFSPGDDDDIVRTCGRVPLWRRDINMLLLVSISFAIARAVHTELFMNE